MQIFSLHLLALAIYFPFVVSVCSGNKKPVIFNFGDSNSDTGGQVAGLGKEMGYPFGRTFFRRPTGRASDGRLVIDFLYLNRNWWFQIRRGFIFSLENFKLLKPYPICDHRYVGICEYLDTHYSSPYLDSLEPNFSNGANFAIVGSCTLPKDFRFNLNIQILQFKHFYNRSVELYSKGRSDLVGEDDFKNALYTIDIGQNDLTASFDSLSYAQAIQRIPSFISEIKDALWAVYELGGRNFWVHNTGPLGCLPVALATNDKLNSSDFDQYGCIKSFNDGAKVFNAKLNALCEQLRSQMENSTIVYVDIYSIKYDLIANSTLYGFKNPLMACCGYGGSPYNIVLDNDKTCFGSQYDVCDEGTPYISWDGIHYTEAANAIVASKVLSTHYSSPPLEFSFFCNSVPISSS